MKATLKLFILTLLGVSLISCTMSEEITLKKDGSVSYSFEVDGSEFMKMMPDSTQNNSAQKSIDSTFAFIDFIRGDSVKLEKLSKKEKNNLKALEPLKAKLHANSEKKEVKLQVLGDFVTIQHLNQAMTALQNLEKEKTKNKKELSQSALFSNVEYTWDGKKFSTKYIINKKSKKEITEDEADMENFKQMFNGIFKVKYNFPERIKKISNQNALLSADKKSVVLEYNITDYFSNPEITNIEIETE